MKLSRPVRVCKFLMKMAFYIIIVLVALAVVGSILQSSSGDEETMDERG